MRGHNKQAIGITLCINTRRNKTKSIARGVALEALGRLEGFFDELFDGEEGEKSKRAVSFCAKIVDGNTVVFENIRSVTAFSDSKIILSLKGKRAVICGKGLSIAELYLGEIRVCGEITALSFE